MSESSDQNSHGSRTAGTGPGTTGMDLQSLLAILSNAFPKEGTTAAAGAGEADGDRDGSRLTLASLLEILDGSRQAADSEGSRTADDEAGRPVQARQEAAGTPSGPVPAQDMPAAEPSVPAQGTPAAEPDVPLAPAGTEAAGLAARAADAAGRSAETPAWQTLDEHMDPVEAAMIEEVLAAGNRSRTQVPDSNRPQASSGDRIGDEEPRPDEANERRPGTPGPEAAPERAQDAPVQDEATAQLQNPGQEPLQGPIGAESPARPRGQDEATAQLQDPGQEPLQDPIGAESAARPRGQDAPEGPAPQDAPDLDSAGKDTFGRDSAGRDNAGKESFAPATPDPAAPAAQEETGAAPDTPDRSGAEASPAGTPSAGPAPGQDAAAGERAGQDEARLRTLMAMDPEADSHADGTDRVLADFVQALPPLTTPAEMRQWDADAVVLGLPGIVLMENAAQGALRVLLRHVPELAGRSIALLMGAGNNGGDAACLSRQLLDLGARPVVYHTRPLDSARGDAAFYVRLATACGVPFRPATDFDGRCDILVDGLLGTGFAGSLREDMLALVELCNAASRTFTLALDIPSGLDAMTGEACPVAIRADATATFAAAKPGLVLPQARPFTGELHVCYIGTPRKACLATPASCRELTAGALAHLPGSIPQGYKNSYGHVLVAGGSPGLSGAAHIAALAALRSGAGLVSVAAPASEVANIKGNRAEIMTLALGPDGTADWSAAHVPLMDDLLARAAALLIGPGLGRSAAAASFLDALLRRPTAALGRVLDADALMILAAHPDWRDFLRAGDVLTPHPGEARALLGGLLRDAQDREHLPHLDKEDRTALELAELLAAGFGCTVVLKGSGTLVAHRGQPTLVYGEDVPQLSCAGSGDCLAGVIASLVARGLPSPMAAGLGVVWHGEAGRSLAGDYPCRGNLAGDIVEHLAGVRRDR